MIHTRKTLAPGIFTLLIILLTSSVSYAQVFSALIREGEALPGDTLGDTITSINNTAQNGIGGFAFTVNTEDVAGTAYSHVWGNASGGTGTVLISEGTIGTLEQTSFESFFGISDAGMASYSASSTDTISGTTGLDGVWVDTTIIQNEEDPIAALPGNFSSFNSRPGITRGGTPYWVGGYSTIQGGSSQDRALFIGNVPTVLLRGGDSITGITETVTVGSGIDFDVRFSANATNYISPIDVDSGSATNDIVMVSNGAAMTAGGSIIREDSPVPASVGGIGGENYDNFDFSGITESGKFLITGDTNNADTAVDEFVMVNSQIVLREDDMINGLTLSGSIEGGFMNEDGDWAVIWDVDDLSGTNLEALILNGQIVLKEGDLVDWNGDGVIDGGDNNAFLTNFTGISALTLGDRDGSGFVNLAFTADIDVDGTVLEGGFVTSAFAIPEPSSVGFLVLVGTSLYVRRRKMAR